MTAGRYDITIEQGSDFELLLTWLDEAGNPMNLTGYSAKMDIRADINDPDPLISLSTDNGRIILGGAAGTVRLKLTAAENGALATGCGVQDLELTSGSGVVTRLLQGNASFSPSVTR